MHQRDKDAYCAFDLVNIHVSRCYTCDAITIWSYDTILYPPARDEIAPSADMPEAIRVDFDEVREVLDRSPRSSAALLRLCIQKLCKHLGEPGENLNADIGALVAKGLKGGVLDLRPR